MVAFFIVLSLAAGTLLGYAFVAHDHGTAEYGCALLVLSIAAAWLKEKVRQRSAHDHGHKRSDKVARHLPSLPVVAVPQPEKRVKKKKAA